MQMHYCTYYYNVPTGLPPAATTGGGREFGSRLE